jgi:hypothetical protein
VVALLPHRDVFERLGQTDEQAVGKSRGVVGFRYSGRTVPALC